MVAWLKKLAMFASPALAVGLVGCAGQPQGAEPLAVFETREQLGRDWPQTVVTYSLKAEGGRRKAEAESFPARITLAGPATLDNMRLVDAATGAEVPFQLSRVVSGKKPLFGVALLESARISFYAELKAGGGYRYELHSGKSNAQRSTPNAQRSRGGLVLDNGSVAIRLPAPGERAFDPPLRFGTDQAEMVKLYGSQIENGVAPGPFQGLRLHQGEWVGGSFFWSGNPDDAPKVTRIESRVTEEGPLFAEAEVRYAFDNGGWYAFTARVLAGDPAIRIDEQFDLGVGNGWNQRLVVSLSRGWEDGGWKPDHAYWLTSEGRESGRDEAFEARMAELGFSQHHQSRRFDYDQPYQKIFDLEVWNPWHRAVHYFGAMRAADLEKAAILPDAVPTDHRSPITDHRSLPIPFLAVVPINAGNWRGNQGSGRMMLFTHQADDFNLHWPLIADPHPRSLTHTGEYDPELPLSFVRRQWALVGGPLQYHDRLHAFRAYDGYITLDHYKDWVLDWPAGEDVTYPRLVFGREDVERLADTLDDHPGADILRDHLYFNDNPERARGLYGSLTGASEWGGPRGQIAQALGRGGDSGMPWTSHYRHTQMAGWAGGMDEALASEHLAEEQRQRLRADLAALCNVLSEPNFNPRGALIHLGNPNMPINRYFALTFAAALIPDHPRANEWLDVSERYLRYKLAMNVAPGGAWSELISYFGASAPHLMQAAAVLERTRRLTEETAALAAMPAAFTLQLLSPVDPRFGTRTVPNWGHEGSTIGTHWMVAAALMRERDPQLARDLAWAWEQQGKPMAEHHDAGFSPRVILHADMLEGVEDDYAPDDFTSTWLPGFGAVLRAHAGHPDETFLAYRQGYMISHSDDNQGDFVLYGKGAPLVVMSLFAYPTHQHPPYIELHREFGWHSHPRRGTRAGRMGGWNASSHVHAYGFADTTDYLRGAKRDGNQEWTRQILFLKPPQPGDADVFLFRDSFSQPEPVWWTLRTDGPAERVTPTEDGFRYQSPYAAALDVRFLQPGPLPLESRQASRTMALYNQAAINWRQAGSPVVNDHHQHNLSAEETLTLTSAGPAPEGRDILVALTTLDEGQAAPAFEPLADGVVKVATAEGTDYVFLAAEPIVFEADGIAFEGLAGAIRIRGDRVHLVVAEGPARVAYRQAVLESAVPAEREFGLAEAGTIKIPAPERVGVYDLEDHGDRITGRMYGVNGGFHLLTAPAWLDRLAELVVDGQTYAPGTSGDTFIIPVMPGEHSFELRPLEQPPVWRDPRAWEKGRLNHD